MPYPNLGARSLKSIQPHEANQIYASFMNRYKALKRGSGLPHDSMLNWPTPQALETNWKSLSAEYADNMKVDMALDVGGATCRVVYQPIEKDRNLITPTRDHKIAACSRSRNSPARADPEWEQILALQHRPVVPYSLPDGAQATVPLATHLSFPRHVPVDPHRVISHKTIKTESIWLKEPRSPWSYEINPVGGNWKETWTLLSVKPSTFWTNKVRDDDRHDGSPSSPEITFLRLELGPVVPSDRDKNDTFSILFRVRIVFHHGDGVPWFPEYPGHESEDVFDVEKNQVVCGHPFGPHVQPSTSHALSHRQRKRYGQTHAGGGIAAGQYRR